MRAAITAPIAAFVALLLTQDLVDHWLARVGIACAVAYAAMWITFKVARPKP